MYFRKDINGLRAIAVIGVVLFHFNASWLPGGFAGVDVFFVISGFLMTGIIFNGMENGDFSIVKFYKARATRIIPALAILCLILLAFGWLYLIPQDYKTLSAHTGSSILFLSNILYWKETGYFDAVSHEKWLLHTWSLSVEWQFYILYPLVLVGMKKIMPINALKILIIFGTIIAFIFCVVATYKWPNPAYYLLPTRAWEMLFGGIAYLYPLRLQGRKKTYFDALGLTLIFCSYFFVSGANPWPGYLASIPVLGAFLIILARNDESVFTSNFFLQKIGAWSYSIYLWHWVFVVANVKYKLELDVVSYLIIVVLFGYLSYAFIEKGKYTLFFMAAVLLGSTYVYFTNGAQTRVDEKFQLDRAQFHKKYYGGSGYPANKIFYINASKTNYDFMFAGDSYGLQYAQALDDRGVKAGALFDHGCLILPNYSRYLDNKEDITCSDEYARLKAELAGNNKPLLLASSWDTYKDVLVRRGSDAAAKLTITEYYNLIQSELKSLIEENGLSRQYFILGVPQRSKINAFECLSRTQLFGFRLINPCSETQPRVVIDINNILSLFSEEYSNIQFIDPNNFLCDDHKCQIIKNREPIHSDQSHLSIFGAPMVIDGVVRRIKSSDD